MQTTRSACRAARGSRSASDTERAVCFPRARQARRMRTAISPRLAINTRFSGRPAGDLVPRSLTAIAFALRMQAHRFGGAGWLRASSWGFPVPQPPEREELKRHGQQRRAALARPARALPETR